MCSQKQDLTATTLPSVKISRLLRQLYFKTSRPLSHHATNRLPHMHVRVPRTGLYLYLFSVRAMPDAKSSIALPHSLTSHFEACLVPSIPAQNP